MSWKETTVSRDTLVRQVVRETLEVVGWDNSVVVIDRAEARALIPILQRFVDTGSIEPQPPTTPGKEG